LPPEKRSCASAPQIPRNFPAADDDLIVPVAARKAIPGSPQPRADLAGRYGGRDVAAAMPNSSAYNPDRDASTAENSHG